MTTMTIEDKLAKMGDKFIKCDEVTTALHVAQVTKKNILLYGPGGYAKSEMAKEFFKMQGIKPFVQVMGAGTTEEKLLGGMNMKEFNDIGRINFLAEESFMAHEYVIFEEMFDAPIQILTILKDILTEGALRNGSQRFEIKTKMIICCTNRSRNEVVEDNSHKALMERFPLEYHVVWDSHTQEDFMELFNKVVHTPVPDLAELIASMHSNGTHISPRTAVAMSGVWKEFGVDGLQYVSGVPHSLLDYMRTKHNQVVQEKKRNESFDKFVEELRKIKLPQQKDENDYETLLMNSTLCGFLYVELQNVHAPDQASNAKLQEMQRYFEGEAKRFMTVAYENAQPTKKLVRPLKQIFEEYETNLAIGN